MVTFIEMDLVINKIEKDTIIYNKLGGSILDPNDF